MRRNVPGVFLVLLLGLSLCVSVGNDFRVIHAQTSQNVTLDLQHFTWNHTTIRVLLLSEQNESWWQSYYIESARRALGIWSDALGVFAADYPDFAYVNALSFESTVSSVVQSGFDIYISWTPGLVSEGGENVGLSATHSVSGVAVNNSITLAVKNGYGVSLGEVEMQNVAVHELGHSLGLDHCSRMGDIMYPASLLGSPAESLSSLDAFGVASVFGWLANSSVFLGGRWPKVSFVSSPSDVSYKLFPISSSNTPPLSFLEPVLGPVRFIFDFILLYIPLNLLLLVVVGVVLLIVLSLVFGGKKKEKKNGNSVCG